MNTNKELDQIVRTWLDDRVVDTAARAAWRRRWLASPRPPAAAPLAGALARPRARARRVAPTTVGDTRDTGTGRNRLMFGITAVTAGAAALAPHRGPRRPAWRSGPAYRPCCRQSGATHVVAADGSGDFTTISEAVAAAAEGDTVLVKPGEYVEVVAVDKNITLQGDGPREESSSPSRPRSAPRRGPDGGPSIGRSRSWTPMPPSAA